MSYDIFFVRRDPGQTFEDALEDVEDSYEGGDPGPLTPEDLELWDAVLPVAREILGPTAETTQEDEEVRELTDQATGIGLALVSGELQIHVPELRTHGDDDIALMGTVYDLARAVEDATGLEGYDPQLGEGVSDTSALSPTRRHWADEPEDEDDDRPGPLSPVAAHPLYADPFDPQPDRAVAPHRWWEFWKS